MKIILLRHEERDNDISFNSNLNENGIIRTIKLSKELNKLDKLYNIKYIFTSPFIRVLQTIYPYSEEYNKKIFVKIENESTKSVILPLKDLYEEDINFSNNYSYEISELYNEFIKT